MTAKKSSDARFFVDYPLYRILEFKLLEPDLKLVAIQAIYTA